MARELSSIRIGRLKRLLRSLDRREVLALTSGLGMAAHILAPWGVFFRAHAWYLMFTASAWYVAPGDLEYNVRLRLVEPMATIVSETVWHPTQRVNRIDKDTLDLTARVPDLREVARWILSAAPYVSVLEPMELRTMVRDLAGEMIKLNAPLEGNDI